MVLAIVWSPFIRHYESIFQGIVAVICYIAPPITAVFLFGVFWKRTSSTAATITLWSGLVLGVMVFLLDWFKDSEWLRQFIEWNVPSMMATFYLFVICSVILLVVSLVRPHEHTEDSRALVWENPAQALASKGWKGIGNYKLLSLVLVIVMVALYIVF
jgi:SSS family solute:Na+ symporter